MINPIKWIAEIGSNHNNNLDRCKELITTAKDIGCNAVKFQLFKSTLWRDSATQEKMKQWELPEKFIPEIYDYCCDKEIEVGYSVFNLNVINTVKDYTDFLKIGSYELLYLDLIVECAEINIPIILSTGMGKTKEIKTAVDYIKSVKKYEEMELDLTIMHCNSSYPAKPENCNLRTIPLLKDDYKNTIIGWSDHTVRRGVINRAIKWGAEVIEFHLDLEDGIGYETEFRHVWRPVDIGRVIWETRQGELADGPKIDKNLKELRKLRTDPIDGMRGIQNIAKKPEYSGRPQF